MCSIAVAPCKVLLFGEHSVVYNKTAIASSINKYTFAVANDSDRIRLSVPEFQLLFDQPTDMVIKIFSNFKDIKNEDALNTVMDWLKSLDIGNPQAIAINAYLFLLWVLTKESGLFRGVNIVIRTQVPIASGLGSSASFAVALSACLLKHFNRIPSDLGLKELDTINEAGFFCEKIMHGNPSGVDNTICTFGGFLAFSKTGLFKKLDCHPCNLMLTDTGIPKNTKIQVQKVADLKIQYASLVSHVLDAMDDVAQSALAMLEKEFNSFQLGRLMIINQGLLSALQMSHHKIDHIISIASKHGIPCKLTGGGGGGYVISLLGSDQLSMNDESKYLKELEKHEYKSIKAQAGCKGVSIRSTLMSIEVFENALLTELN